MIRYLVIFFAVFFTFSTYSLPAVDVNKKKLLVLVICSDDLPVYGPLQEMWRNYMHSDPEYFESYFIRGNPDLATEAEIQGDVLYLRT
jgi:hypothetical protein